MRGRHGSVEGSCATAKDTHHAVQTVAVLVEDLIISKRLASGMYFGPVMKACFLFQVRVLWQTSQTSQAYALLRDH